MSACPYTGDVPLNVSRWELNTHSITARGEAIRVRVTGMVDVSGGGVNHMYGMRVGVSLSVGFRGQFEV